MSTSAKGKRRGTFALPRKPRDLNHPRTGLSELTFATTLVGATPKAVVWVSELKGPERRAKPTYRLIVLSDTRLYVTNGKTGIFDTVNESAHIYDLLRVNIVPGDRISLDFRQLKISFDDGVGPQIISTIWYAIKALNYEVLPALLPKFEGVAAEFIEQLEKPANISPIEGHIAIYRATCDYLGIQKRPSAEGYLIEKLHEFQAIQAGLGKGCAGDFDLGEACSSLNSSSYAASPLQHHSMAEFPAGKKFNGSDIPCLARALSSSTWFSAVCLNGLKKNDFKLGGNELRALLEALDGNAVIEAVELVDIGLTAAKLEKVLLPKGFPGLQMLNISENSGLGTRGLERFFGKQHFMRDPAQSSQQDTDLGHSETSESNPSSTPPDASRDTPLPLHLEENDGINELQRLEFRGCGSLSKGVPLRLSWIHSLTELDISRCVLERVGSESLADWLIHARVLSTLCCAQCSITAAPVLLALAENKTLSMGGVLRAVKMSGNHITGDDTYQALRTFTAQTTGLARLDLVRCELNAQALDAIFEGIVTRALILTGITQAISTGNNCCEPEVRMLALHLAGNNMYKKHAIAFEERLGRAVVCTPLKILDLGGCRVGTLGMCHILNALLAKPTPHKLAVLSLSGCFAKKGFFARKKNHSNMASLLARVVNELALVKLYLCGAVGSHLRSDLVPLLQALKDNRTIKVLDITNNRGGDVVINALAEAITFNTTLQELSFDKNDASMDALLLIGNAFQQNKSIFKLIIPEEDAKAVSIKAGDDDIMEEMKSKLKERVILNVRNWMETKEADNGISLASVDIDSEERGSFVLPPKQPGAVRRRRQSAPAALEISETGRPGPQQTSAVRNHSEVFPKESKNGLKKLVAEDSITDSVSFNASELLEQYEGGEDNFETLAMDVGKEKEITPSVLNEHPSNTTTPRTTMDSMNGEGSDAIATESAPPDVLLEVGPETKDVDKRRTLVEEEIKQKITHCLRVFEEIYSSEETYVRDLGVICKVFYDPCSEDEIITHDEQLRLFGNVRELLKIHSELLEKLRISRQQSTIHELVSTLQFQKCQKLNYGDDDDDNNINKKSRSENTAGALASLYARNFAEMLPFLTVYAAYCNQYQAAVALVKDLSESNVEFCGLRLDLKKIISF